MSNNKQTAVEWLEYQLDQYGKTHFFSKRELIAKAKAMEKEQAFRFWCGGIECTEEGGKSFEQYYTETYGE
jgi:hypothetical protein